MCVANEYSRQELGIVLLWRMRRLKRAEDASRGGIIRRQLGALTGWTGFDTDSIGKIAPQLCLTIRLNLFHPLDPVLCRPQDSGLKTVACGMTD